MGTPDRVRLAKALELAERQAAELKLLRAEVRKPHRDPAAEALRAEVLDLRKTLRVMERALKPLQAEHDEMEEVAAAVADAEPPAWAISVPRGATGIPGVPTILATDWHVGETVRPELVPIVRGSKKILGRNAQIDLEADTFVMGHYHRRVPLPQVIVGDSMVGFNEMSVGEGYDYAPPSQELWLTHPDRGPTIHAPVFLEAKKRTQRIEPWVSFEHAAT
jgi:hypothetical protein